MAQTTDDTSANRPRPLAALVVSLGAALGSAALIGLWWASPVPTFVFFTSVLHGLLLGVLLYRAFREVHIAVRTWILVMSIVAGLISVVALLLLQYASDVSIYRSGYVRALRSMQVEPSSSGDGRFELYDRNLLVPLTGRGGVAGYLRLRYPRRYAFAAEALVVVVLSVAVPVCIGRRAAVQYRDASAAAGGVPVDAADDGGGVAVRRADAAERRGDALG